MKLFLLLFTFVLFSIQTQAQVEWTGDGDNISWGDPLNWDTGEVPQEGDDIIIDNGSPNYLGAPFTYGSLKLLNGSNLLIQGDIYVFWDITIDATSTLSTDVQHLNDISKVFAGSYDVTGDIDILFSGYVPQIGNSFKVINASLSACGIATTDIVEEGQATGFQVYLGVQCQQDGILHTVTDINYTTAKAWDGEGGDNAWSTAANWDPNGVPATDDIVIINLPGAGGYVNTTGAGTTQADQILIGDNNTLAINGDLAMFSIIQMSDAASIVWNGGEISKTDPNVTSAIINYGEITITGPQLKSIDGNFEIWNYGIINHNQGNLNLNNGRIQNFNNSQYNINGDFITIGYTSGTNHSIENLGASTISKTTGTGVSRISLTSFTNNANVYSQSGILAIEEHIDSQFGRFGGEGSTLFPSGYVFTGELSPGNSPGVLTIAGNLTTAASARFNIEIDGPTAGTNYDQIIVTDEATLDGTINITLGYLPANDAIFEIVTAGTLISCNFPAQITANFDGTDYTFDVVCQNNTLYLKGPGAILSAPRFKAEDISMYPNPIKNEINIKLQRHVEGSWAIFNQLGQNVKHGNLKGLNTKIDVQTLVSGFYALQIKDENNRNVLVKKIIKN